MASHSEITHERRVAIITLRMLANDSLSTIAKKLNLLPSSVHRIYWRAIERTDVNLRGSFDAVVQNVKDLPRSGRRVTVMS